LSNLLLNIADEIFMGAINKSINSKGSGSIKIKSIYHINGDKSSCLKGLENISYNIMDFWSMADGSIGYPQGGFTYFIDENLLNKLAKYETYILEMYSRMFLSRNIHRDYSFKKKFYYYQLSYWYDFLKVNKITHFIATNVPHEGFDYIIYLLSDILNIKVCFFYQIPFGKLSICGNKIEGLFDPVNKEYDNLLPLLNIDVVLSSEVQDIFNSLIEDNSPFYMKDGFSNGLIVCFINKLKKIKRYLLEATRPYRSRVHRNEVVLPYMENISCVDLNHEYIYFGLHYQPEMTTNPMAGRYQDQFLSIKLISDNLPKGVLIYVKEHPQIYKNQDFQCRFREFYSMIGGLGNVKIVNSDTSTFELIKQSKAVATITGTVGWEALFRNKPVIIFGEVYYKYCDGVFSVYSKGDIVSAIKLIFEENYKPDLNKLKLYLQSIYNVSIKSFVDSLYFYDSGFITPSKANKDLCVGELEKYIGKFVL
jgi:hypothetical protein